MQQLLNEIIVGNFFAFLLLFVRFGLALMIMPGIGDSFVSANIRLMFAVAFSFVLTPMMMPVIPQIPATTDALVLLILSEAVVGIFIGTIMRVLVSALDTAGMIISIQAGFSNAMVFNPTTASQGSLVGALYGTLGVTLLLATDMHHFMLAAIVDSYQTFPAVTQMPDSGTMLGVIAAAVTTAFRTGVQISLPFIVVGLVVQMGFGLLGRLMPQVQIFFLALPLQIGLSLIMITMTLSAGMLFWISRYQDNMQYYLGF